MAFIVNRRTVSEQGMATMRVVPTLQPINDRHLRFRPGLEAPAAQDFALEGCEEALSHRVVVRIPHRAHRGHDASLAAAYAEGVGGALGSRDPSDGSPRAADAS